MVNPDSLGDLDGQIGNDELNYWENYIRDHGLDEMEE